MDNIDVRSQADNKGIGMLLTNIILLLVRMHEINLKYRNSAQPSVLDLELHHLANASLGQMHHLTKNTFGHCVHLVKCVTWPKASLG